MPDTTNLMQKGRYRPIEWQPDHDYRFSGKDLVEFEQMLERTLERERRDRNLLFAYSAGATICLFVVADLMTATIAAIALVGLIVFMVADYRRLHRAWLSPRKET